MHASTRIIANIPIRTIHRTQTAFPSLSQLHATNYTANMASSPALSSSSTTAISTSSDANTSVPDDTCVSTPLTHREPPSRQPSHFSMDKTSTTRSASTPLQKLMEEPRWPLGVISGGTVIDMLEHLSQTTQHSDYALTVWLEKHYVKPFGRIDRLDGLIVGNELHLWVFTLLPTS